MKMRLLLRLYKPTRSTAILLVAHLCVSELCESSSVDVSGILSGGAVLGHSVELIRISVG